MARFFWVIRLYARNGFFVIIDNHTEDPTVENDPSLWFQVRRTEVAGSWQASG